MIPAAESLPALMTSLQLFMMNHGASLPDHTRDAMLDAAGHPSPVDRIVNSAEALYAVKGQLNKEGREIGAQLALYAASYGYHGMGERGAGMAKAYNRIGGFSPPPGQEWPSAEEDPEPRAQFVEPAAADASASDPAPADPPAEEPATT